MITKFEESIREGHHQNLSLMAGTWQGTARTWFEPGKLADESVITGTIKQVLDGRFLLHEYKSSFAGKALEGITILGYDLNTRSFQTAWIDSFHMGTGIMLSKTKTETGPFEVQGGYEVIQNNKEEIWGWRTEVFLGGKNNLIIKAFNIDPEGQESLASEINYERKID